MLVFIHPQLQMFIIKNFIINQTGQRVFQAFSRVFKNFPRKNNEAYWNELMSFGSFSLHKGVLGALKNRTEEEI